MNAEIGFGIIGLSGIARIHLKAIKATEDCKIVGASSRNPDKRLAFQTETGIPVYADYHDLLRSPDVQAICICTASGYHLEPTIAAARAGKHVFCEKPLEINMIRAQQMVDACKQSGVKLACVFQNRFRSDFIKLKEAVEGGLLGTLIHGNAMIPWYRDPEYYSGSTWKGTISGDGGGALINQGIHTVDLLQTLFGPVDSVWGKVRTAKHNIEGEDLANAHITFKQGATGTIQASTAFVPGYPERLEVYGSKGSIIYAGGIIKTWNLPEAKIDDPIGATNNHDSSNPNLADSSLHQNQLEDFVEAIHQDRDLIIDGEEGLKSLRIIQAIYDSSRTGQVIRF